MPLRRHEPVGIIGRLELPDFVGGARRHWGDESGARTDRLGISCMVNVSQPRS